MPPRIDEYDVFTIPHSRMKQLVNSCNKNLHVTDFADNDALFSLLTNLQSIFGEFKSHEDIENEHIMAKLKSKLAAMAVYNSAVCNCHKDDEFTPLIELVETGYLCMNKSRTIGERISYGVRLRKALARFTRVFVPHMKEEEDVFQPLLVKYFTRAELVAMKNAVIKAHMQQRKAMMAMARSSATATTATPHSPQSTTTPVSTFSSSFCSSAPTPLVETTAVASIDSLPNELMLKVVGMLPLCDRFRAARVSKRWNALVYDASHWSELRYVDWRRHATQQEEDLNEDYGEDDDDFFYAGEENIHDDDDQVINNNNNNNNNEVRLFRFWLRCLLPRVGADVVKLDLSHCRSLDNNTARRVLQMCANLHTLDISYTKLSDNAFRSVQLNKLTDLNCEGCTRLSDNAFKHLLLSTLTASILASYADCDGHTRCAEQCSGQQQQSDHAFCERKLSIEDLESTNSTTRQQERTSEPASGLLSSINLSGCWSITDFGLSYIASKYNLSGLEYLNLSGCLNLTPEGLGLFVETSRMLSGENFFYCDNIVDGPMRTTANGCANLGCAQKFCCRSGL